MIYVLVFDQDPDDRMSIIGTGEHVKYRAGLLGVNRQIHNETHGWLFTRPLTFNDIFESCEALERMTPSQRSVLQSITIRDNIDLQKRAHEAALANSAMLLRDAAKALEVLCLDCWQETSPTDEEVANSIIYRSIEPLLTAIGEARGVFDAAIEVLHALFFAHEEP